MTEKDQRGTPEAPGEEPAGPGVLRADGGDRGNRVSLRSKERRDELWRRAYAKAVEPVGPFRSESWRSPVRGPWLTSVFGSILLVGIPVMFITGLVSYAAYNPRLPGNDTTPTHGVLGFFLFSWITNPSWLYRVSEGIHVILGFALVPILLAKLWSVMPKFFHWPPVFSPGHLLERLSLMLLVGGVMFQFFTGIFDVNYFYFWKFSFYDAHYYGAWAFMAGFVVHVGLKLPLMVRSLRSRRLRTELATPLADTVPEPVDRGGLVSINPAKPTISRRGLLGLVAATSAAAVVTTAGENVGGWTRSVALLAPRGRSYGNGPTDFQINKPAASVGVTKAKTGPDFRLQLAGSHYRYMLSRADLLSLPQSTQRLPIACVEGWATVQTWTGVRLADLARMVGVDQPELLEVESLQEGGAFAKASLNRDQATDTRSLLALKVNGADLTLDHGYPARIIVPALPGVHNTKWVNKLTFSSAR
ncbi:MAG: molybdopterin-dependent oxidoreductase [Actinomycetota bacterium]|nr:molybdopterin-dependent oxidoreductase [Actinomycetota bacterium]